MALPEDRPDALMLLDAARRHLLEELLPLLPDERRLDVLMIANAMGIAGREAQAGDATLREALSRLAAIYGEIVSDALSEEEARALLSRLNRRLAEDIRAGAFDAGPKRAALLAHLEATTRARVAITNPKVLD
jgi:hypothetical protein